MPRKPRNQVPAFKSSRDYPVPGLIAKFNDSEDEYQGRLTEYEANHPELVEARQCLRKGKASSPYLTVIRPRMRGVRVDHPKYATAEELYEAIDLYAEMAYRAQRPLTMIGLARCVGFWDRRSLEAFCMKDETLARDPEFRGCWSYAKGLVEHFTVEEALAGRLASFAAKLMLNTFGYTDQAQDPDDPAANLRINEKFLASLGAGGAIQIRHGDKTPEGSEGPAIAGSDSENV